MSDEPKNAEEAKAQIATQKNNKALVRALENDKQKAGNTSLLTADSLMDDSKVTTTDGGKEVNISANSENLNKLWQRVRYFLNGKDDEGKDVEHSMPGRVRFTEVCTQKASLHRGQAEGILPQNEVIDAFVSSRFVPSLTNEEFRAVFRAIEAYHDEGRRLVNWRNILKATVDREPQCVYGIFPRNVSTRHPFGIWRSKFAIFASLLTRLSIILFHLETEEKNFVRCRK